MKKKISNETKFSSSEKKSCLWIERDIRFGRIIFVPRVWASCVCVVWLLFFSLLFCHQKIININNKNLFGLWWDLYFLFCIVDQTVFILKSKREKRYFCCCCCCHYRSNETHKSRVSIWVWEHFGEKDALKPIFTLEWSHFLFMMIFKNSFLFCLL